MNAKCMIRPMHQGNCYWCKCLGKEFGTQVRRHRMVNVYWFMQDSARRHRVAVVFSCLDDTFENYIITLDVEKFMGQGIEWLPP